MSAPKSILRLASRAPALAAPSRTQLLRQPLRSSRPYSSTPPKSSKTGIFLGAGALVAAAGGGGGYYLYTQQQTSAEPKVFKPTQEDYQKVYNEIAQRLEEKDDYDDGSYGPVLVRLAWHCSGTYDKETNTGGSNGATMRFDPEADHGANAGMKAARDFLEPIKASHPWITYSDLWTLGGLTAMQEMQGPSIPWRPGRSDRDISFCTPDGRLPDGAKEQDHLRAIFYRMGFDDQEIVALSGAHALGRCHTDRSGFEGPWTFSPTVMSNDYFRLLVEEKWTGRKWDGPRQFQDLGSKSLMMLPSDMALVRDESFKRWVELYARDDQRFYGDFRDGFVKLLELGVPFEREERMVFKTLE